MRVHTVHGLYDGSAHRGDLYDKYGNSLTISWAGVTPSQSRCERLSKNGVKIFILFPVNLYRLSRWSVGQLFGQLVVRVIRSGFRMGGTKVRWVGLARDSRQFRKLTKIGFQML